MNALNELTSILTFSAACYVVGASVCRIRFGDIAKSWAALYVAVGGYAMWTLLDLLKGQTTHRDATIVVVAAYYVFKTREAWANGVPPIAKAKGLS